VTCQFDRDEQCFCDCEGCSRYKLEIPCPECDSVVPRTEIDKYDGMCRECRLKEEFDNGALLEEFFEANPDIEQAYKEFIDEVWYQ
jgi:hypothetical protein